MVITAFKVVAPHEVRQELLAEVVLDERNGPVSTLAVERYPIRCDEQELELTAHFSPANRNLSLAVTQKKETVGHFLFHCPHPCEMNFRLPSFQMIRLFCDPAQTAPRYGKSA